MEDEILAAEGDEPVAALERVEGARLRLFVFGVAVCDLGCVVGERGS